MTDCTEERTASAVQTPNPANQEVGRFISRAVVVMG
jgi:hypothetical protein